MLQPVPYRRLPGWLDDDHAAAFRAFRRSCKAVIDRAEAASCGTAHGDQSQRLAQVCRHALCRHGRGVTRSEARAFFEHFFEPHRLAQPALGGFLTGYYEPHIAGSMVPTSRFRIPIYRRPPDLESVVPESQRASPAPYSHMRRTPSGLAPYSTRAEIEDGALAGQGLELIWLADPVDAFFAQVQGSARIRLPDGSDLAITYDGKNGHPYTSIGRVLIERGAISAERMSMATLADYLRANADRGREIMRHNESFVFFRPIHKTEGDRARGVLDVPLTPGRSLAVDATVHDLGSPVFVTVPRLRGSDGARPFRRLMIAQDVGSAIRGPQRGDIYFGSGDAAGRIAGTTRHHGQFHLLLPRARSRRDEPAGERQR